MDFQNKIFPYSISAMPPYANRKRSGYLNKKAPFTKKANIKTIVKREVARAVETKQFSVEALETQFSTLTALQYPLIRVPVSASSQGRIGDKVDSVGISVKGHIYNNDTSNDSHVRVMVVQNKSNEGFSTADLLEGVNNTDVPLTGTMIDMWRSVNTDKYRVLATRVLKMGNGGNPQGMGTKMFKMWIPMKTKINWSGGGAQNIQPLGKDCYLVIFGSRSNDDDLAGHYFETSFQSKFYYKDA